MQKLAQIATDIKRWFVKSQRSFPWREDRSPYSVWVSEVMLQQTQASVVVGYYKRWMDRFPTLEALALAPLEEVIKQWEGLGYYVRAKNLHKGARYLLENHRGVFPSSKELLEKIPGVGPYTVGAILSFAFHQKAPAVDANAIRVLTRLFAMEEEIHTQSSKKWLQKCAHNLLPEEEPWVFVEALIELGATLCTPKPKCSKCPVQPHCLGSELEIASLLPKKQAPKPITLLHREVVLLFTTCQKKVLLSAKKEKGIMANLYEFPYVESSLPSPSADFIRKVTETFFTPFLPILQLSCVEHSFTRYRAILYPYIFKTQNPSAIEGFDWVLVSDLDKLPFSSGHKKILTEMKKHL
ncbi:MAG: A/G-specific adenine glycosylase [Chlamydiales bacterium]|nr:A/G-specific adenine glycosylase [Chlamydiales bacterium]